MLNTVSPLLIKRESSLAERLLLPRSFGRLSRDDVMSRWWMKNNHFKNDSKKKEKEKKQEKNDHYKTIVFTALMTETSFIFFNFIFGTEPFRSLLFRSV